MGGRWYLGSFWILPTAPMATWGGTITGSMYVPPMLPMFERLRGDRQGEREG